MLLLAKKNASFGGLQYIAGAGILPIWSQSRIQMEWFHYTIVHLPYQSNNMNPELFFRDRATTF